MKTTRYDLIVPNNIKRIIEESGVKYQYIAKRGGYTTKQLSEMVNYRKVIKASDVLKIAKALGVNVNELFRHDEDQ